MKKLIGILVCMLMIVAVVLPAGGTVNKIEQSKSVFIFLEICFFTAFLSYSHVCAVF